MSAILQVKTKKKTKLKLQQKLGGKAAVGGLYNVPCGRQHAHTRTHGLAHNRRQTTTGLRTLELLHSYRGWRSFLSEDRTTNRTTGIFLRELHFFFPLYCLDTLHVSAEQGKL